MVVLVPWSKRFALLGDGDMYIPINKGELKLCYVPQRREVEANVPPSNPHFIGRNQAIADITELLLKPEVFSTFLSSANGYRFAVFISEDQLESARRS